MLVCMDKPEKSTRYYVKYFNEFLLDTLKPIDVEWCQF